MEQRYAPAVGSSPKLRLSRSADRYRSAEVSGRLRLVYLTDAMSHAVLAGVAAASLLGVSLLAGSNGATKPYGKERLDPCPRPHRPGIGRPDPGPPAGPAATEPPNFPVSPPPC